MGQDAGLVASVGAFDFECRGSVTSRGSRGRVVRGVETRLGAAQEIQSSEGGGDEQLPRKFDRYELLKKLATGGMAEIFLAKQSGLEGFEKVVVLKRILPHLAQV